MSISVGACPLCGGERQRFFEQLHEGGRTWIYRLCETCGLVFQSPRMNDAELTAFYASGYRDAVQGTEAPTDKDLRIQAGRARLLLAFCKGRLPRPTRHLDIGSSSGALLRAFAAEYGCESVGVEPGEAYRNASHSRGVYLFPDLATLEREESGTFDLISMIHVLEHIPDPVAHLSRLRERWMARGGHLLVEVPNLYGHQAVEPAHLLAFSARTLRRTLEAAGFRLRAFRTHGEPRSPVLRLYITALAEAHPAGQRRPDARTNVSIVRLRRKLGLLVLNMLTERLPNWTWRELPEAETEGGPTGGRGA